jgi:predicted transcriptional regulator
VGESAWDGSQSSTARRAAGELEGAVLAVLQTAGGALTPGEVGDRLDGDLSYSTVVTILGRLLSKRILTRSRHGRAYAYRPVADMAGLAALRMHQVLSAVSDRDAVLARFVGDLSAADEALFRQLLAIDPS